MLRNKQSFIQKEHFLTFWITKKPKYVLYISVMMTKEISKIWEKILLQTSKSSRLKSNNPDRERSQTFKSRSLIFYILYFLSIFLSIISIKNKVNIKNQVKMQKLRYLLSCEDLNLNHPLKIFLGSKVTSTNWTLQASINFHFPLKYLSRPRMKETGNKSWIKSTFVAETVKSPKLLKLKESPKIKKNNDITILTKAITNVNMEPENISQSFLDVSCIFSMSNLLSILLEPILRAAEKWALHI